MRRLRPTTQSRRVVADWSTTASPEHKRRMAELLRTLADGTWESRWYCTPLAGDPEVVEIRPDTHVHVMLRVLVDEDDGGLWGDIFTIISSAGF